MTKAVKSNAAKAKQFFADKMAFTTGPVEVSHQIEKGEDVAIIDLKWKLNVSLSSYFLLF